MIVKERKQALSECPLKDGEKKIKYKNNILEWRGIILWEDLCDTETEQRPGKRSLGGDSDY